MHCRIYVNYFHTLKYMFTIFISIFQYVSMYPGSEN